MEATRQARQLADEGARTGTPVERDFVWAEWLLGTALVALTSELPPRRPKLLSEAETHLTEVLTRCRRINLVEVEPGVLPAWARFSQTTDGSAWEHRPYTNRSTMLRWPSLRRMKPVGKSVRSWKSSWWLTTMMRSMSCERLRSSSIISCRP